MLRGSQWRRVETPATRVAWVMGARSMAPKVAASWMKATACRVGTPERAGGLPGQKADRGAKGHLEGAAQPEPRSNVFRTNLRAQHADPGL